MIIDHEIVIMVTETNMIQGCMGSILAEYRKSVGLSQAALSAKLGINRVSLAHWETGRRQVSVRYLCSISQLTGIDPRDLRPDLATALSMKGDKDNERNNHGFKSQMDAGD